jgi:hypothetical protein
MIGFSKVFEQPGTCCVKGLDFVHPRRTIHVPVSFWASAGYVGDQTEGLVLLRAVAYHECDGRGFWISRTFGTGLRWAISTAGRSQTLFCLQKNFDAWQFGRHPSVRLKACRSWRGRNSTPFEGVDTHTELPGTPFLEREHPTQTIATSDRA